MTTGLPERDTNWAPWLTSAFLLGMPLSRLGAGLEPYDLHRLMQIALLLACSAVAVFHRSSRRRLWERLVTLPAAVRLSLLSFFLLGLLSVVFSPLPRWSLLEWCLFFQLGVLVASTSAYGRAGGFRIFETAVVWTVVALCTLLAAAYAGSLASGFLDWTALHPAFSNRRFLGQVMTMTIPLVVAAASREGRFRGALWLLAAMWWCWTLGNGSRGTFLGLAAGLALASVVFGLRAGNLWRTGITTLAAGAFAFWFLAFLLPSWAGAEVFLETARFASGDSLLNPNGRDLLWGNALVLVSDHPLVGAGPMMFATLGTISAHPHSAALQILSEWGVPASLMAFVVLLASSQSVWRSRGLDRTSMYFSASTCAALLCASVGGLAQSLVDGVLVVPTSQVLLATVLGWLWAAFGRDVPIGREGKGDTCVAGDIKKTRAGSLILAGSVLLTAAGVAALSSPEWRNSQRLKDSYQPQYLTLSYLDRMAPRFWAQGRLQPSPGQPYDPWN